MPIKLKSSVLWSVVLYIDIRDFTYMTSDLGEEDTLEQVGYFYEIVDESVQRFGGWVNNKMGDGVLCFFGFGIENNIWKEKAIQSALAIQSSLACSSKVKFSAGIGISSGKIANNDNIFIGDPINLAARLSSVARGGQIYICENSHPSFKDGYEISDSAPITVKGLTRGKLVFNVSSQSCVTIPEKPLSKGLKSYG